MNTNTLILSLAKSLARAESTFGEVESLATLTGNRSVSKAKAGYRRSVPAEVLATLPKDKVQGASSSARVLNAFDSILESSGVSMKGFRAAIEAARTADKAEADKVAPIASEVPKATKKAA